MSPEPLPATPGHSALHDWLHIGGLGGALLLGIGTWAAVPPALEAAAGLSVVDGAWTAAFEDKLDAEAPHRALALPLWGALEFFAFGDGRDGVVLAQDGLLFTDEELRLYPHEAENTAESLRLILKARDLLAQKNVKLVVALLPAKVRLHQGQAPTPCSSPTATPQAAPPLSRAWCLRCLGTGWKSCWGRTTSPARRWRRRRRGRMLSCLYPEEPRSPDQ